MSDMSPEAVTAAVQIADLRHLLRTHALGALRDAQRQVRDASEQIGRILDGAGASVQERRAAIEALAAVLATLTVGAVHVEAQSCFCGADERVTLEIGHGNEAAVPERSRLVGEGVPPTPTPTVEAERSLSPEAIEAAYIERGHRPLRKLALVKKPSTAQCYAAAGDEPDPEAA